MDQVYVIRHKVLVEKRSTRSVARELGVSRNTVRRYVEGAQPCVRAAVARPSPVKDALWPRIEQVLADAPNRPPFHRSSWFRKMPSANASDSCEDAVQN